MPNKNPVSDKAGQRKEYRIWIKPGLALLKPKPNMLVGKVINRENKTVARIILNDYYLKEFNMRELCVISANVPSPKIIISTEFLSKLIQKSDTSLFAIYHELGHTKQKDSVGRTYEDIRNERKAAILEGRACKDELEADAFAARHLGADLAIKALTQLKEDRLSQDKELGYTKKPNSIMALQEYDYRIKAIQELKEKLDESK